MVLRLRGSARTVSAVLVLLWLWSLPHRSQPDICVPAGFEQHDESKHVFTAVSPNLDDEHCVVCHWMRSLKPAFASRAYTAAAASAGSALFVPARNARGETALCRVPARAPPVS